MVRQRLLWRYPGSKAILSQWHVSLFPARVQTYVSAFAGTAADLLHRQPSGVEVLNDLDESIYNTFVVVQHPRMCETLKRLLLATPDGRRQFLECKEAMKHPDPVKRAWAYLMAANTSSLATDVRRVTWLRKESDFYRLPEQLDWWHGRLRYVKLQCHSWQVVIDEWDKEGVLFYLDPPYLPSTLRRKEQLYRHVMTTEEHVNLLLRLRRCRASVLLCGYPNDLYDLVLSDWVRREKVTRCHMGSKDCRTEVVWLNYKPPNNGLHR